MTGLVADLVFVLPLIYKECSRRMRCRGGHQQLPLLADCRSQYRATGAPMSTRWASLHAMSRRPSVRATRDCPMWRFLPESAT